ncbi:hypothetical protein MRX96_004901 [Rhipicephalus microplus]
MIAAGLDLGIKGSNGQSTAKLPPPAAFVLDLPVGVASVVTWSWRQGLLHPRGLLQKCSSAPPEPPRGLTYIPENAPRRPVFEGWCHPWSLHHLVFEKPRCTCSFPSRRERSTTLVRASFSLLHDASKPLALLTFAIKAATHSLLV